MKLNRLNLGTISTLLLASTLCSVCCLLLSPAFASEIRDVQVLWNVEDEPLNIGDVLHFKVTTDVPGSVIIDISTVHQSIQLYDNGTNGDTVAGDRIHELDYVIFEGDTVEEGPILAHFIADDGTEARTYPVDDITPRITIDGTRPMITNDGVSPSPFNPYTQYAYIRYILTEASSVSIKIYRDQNQLIRTLGTPSGKPGENHTTWNGADDEGNVMSDGVYSYRIAATDRAGNEALPTSGGCILSTVYLTIDNSLIAPNPFSPDGDNVDDTTWITFDVSLIATEEQLVVLGFGGENLITTTPEDDDDISPFALIGISMFGSSGEALGAFPHDLTPDADTDFVPNGWPNGEAIPDVPPGSGNFLGMELPDYSDVDKTNDWDTLVPFHGPFQSSDGSYYKTSFSVGWDAEGAPDGTYLFSIECELVGRTWEFVSYMTTETGFIIGEKWHAAPASHHGVTAFPRRKSVIIDRKEVTPVDDDPPIVTSTSPSDRSVVDPTRETIKEVVATLDDGADGSGVDPIESTIAVLSPLGNKLNGQHVPFGINSIKLVLDTELAVSGTYTIEIVPVDKRGNKAAEPSAYTFVIEDTSAPTVVLNTVEPKPTEFDDDGNPIDPYVQPIGEISVVLTDGLTGSGVDLENSSLYLRNVINETISGELSLDVDNRKLIYVFDEPVAVSGTYTIVVIAVDHAGAKGIYTYQFVLDMAENTVLRYDQKIYIVIYAATVSVDGATGAPIDLSGIGVEETEDFPAMITELSRITDFAVKFAPYDMELSQNAELTLYYEDDQLPLGIEETELSIYAFKSQAQDWVQLANVVLLAEESKLTASINYIDQYYIIAYTSPVVQSRDAEVVLNPSKYFNPNNEELLTFTFATDITDYQVQIYNTGGDRIMDIKELGRSDNSLGWDGRNEDGEIVRNGIFICRILYNVDGRSKSLDRLIAVIK